MHTLLTHFMAILGFLLLASEPTAAEAAGSLRTEGTEWIVQRDGAAELRSADLVGAEFNLAGGAVLRIDGVKQVDGASGRRWWAHDLSLRIPGQGWLPLCAPHSDGTQFAIALPGRESPNGSLADDPDAFAISCTSGALAKCLRMGYEPWQHAPGGANMRAVFNACVRMVRADYTGTGVPYTENGRLIDVYDAHGIQSADRLTEQRFEAGWDEHGAVCVHHARVAAKVSLQALEASSARLRGNVGEACTEERARALGATVFNRSTPASPAPD